MSDTPRESHRSFTVRVPISRYVEMSKRAQRDGKHLNQTVNELLILGMGEGIKLDDALAALLRRASTKDGESNDGNS